jgi:hypothetical protein
MKFLTVGACVALPSFCLAQTPLGPEILVSSNTGFEQFPPAVACDRDANCFVAWVSRYFTSDPDGIAQYAWARPFSPFGAALDGRILRTEDDYALLHAIGEERGFTLIAQKSFPRPGSSLEDHRSPILQKFDSFLTPLRDFLELPLRRSDDGDLVAAAALPGAYAFVTLSNDLPVEPADCQPCANGVFLSLATDQGRVLKRRIQVNEVSAGDERPSRGGVAADAQGRLIVAFTRRFEELETTTDVWVRLFGSDGGALGHEIKVNRYDVSEQRNPVVAAASDGRFVVAWQSFGQDGDNEGVYARLFAGDGTPLTDEIQVNETTHSAQALPALATDAAGNFVVSWQDDAGLDPLSDRRDIRLRLFRADGSPVAGELLLNQVFDDEQTLPKASFSPNGTIVVAWMNSGTFDRNVETDIRARFLSASPGQEPCGIVGEQVLCDTGRTGGRPELRLSWGGRPGEVTLFGDWDGDGREDLCAWYRGRFRCDLDHEGAPAEAQRVFGLPTDVPLLGDVDGDGRAETCVRRKRRLLCDTAHDGGRPESEIVLGTGRETPLLGDLDGDGRDDLCLFDGGLWTCRTQQGARSLIAFGAPGDRAALGDLDRDGRDDLCVLRAGQMLCDTVHDGGAAEGTLALVLPADSRPLFGNLDGL